MKARGGRGTVVAVATITLAGLALRCAAARGGLWLDEAWSAIFAQAVATPAGVLLNVNHDNNHHLNTLWLQWVGADASPLWQRALSIAAGGTAIPVAATIAGRRGRGAAIVAAIAFAFAPFLVTYGAEARGYAPMLLAWLCAIGIADRWLDAPGAPPPATALALAALLGCMAQATMVFGLAALAAWVGVVRWHEGGARRIAGALLRLFGPAAIATIAFGAILWAAAAADPRGFQFGNREAHDWLRWAMALDQLWTWSLGLSVAIVAAAACGAIVRDRIGVLALIAGGALPLGVAVLALPNSGASRYYAVAVPPLLLWSAVALPVAWRAGRGWRIVAVGMAVTFGTGAIVRDGDLPFSLRGDPARAVAAMAAQAPAGTIAAVEHPRSSAILIAAARSRAYALRIADAPCPAAPFLFVERDGDAAFPVRPVRCGTGYRERLRGDPGGLSGTHWRLYSAGR